MPTEIDGGLASAATRASDNQIKAQRARERAELRQTAKLRAGVHSLVDVRNKLGGCRVYVSHDVATIVIYEVRAISCFVATTRLAVAQMMVVEDVQSNHGLISWHARSCGCYIANVQFFLKQNQALCITHKAAIQFKRSLFRHDCSKTGLKAC